MSGPPYPRNGAGRRERGFVDDSTLPLLAGLIVAIAVVGTAIALGLPNDRDPRRASAAGVATTATAPQRTVVTPDGEPVRMTTLTVTNAGEGSGTIRVNGETSDCSQDCNFEVESGEEVTLVATASRDSAFAGWTDPCDVLRTCTIFMNSARTIVALFDVAKPDLGDECSDGIDNDGDEFVDDDDLECIDGADSEDPPPVVAPPAVTPPPAAATQPPPPVATTPRPPAVAPPPPPPPPPPPG